MTNIFPEISMLSQKKEDNRGYLQVLYESETIVLKRSFSKKGVFRGMHIQTSPNPQTKLIRVISGKIIDFIVNPNDRKIHWQEIDLNNDWVLIKPHLAHGFYALEDTVFEYICDGAYNEASEEAYSITDFITSEMGIKEFMLSEKDSKAKKLKVSK